MADSKTQLSPQATQSEVSLDPCTADILREGRLLWRQHRKLEMVVTTIVAPVAAFLAAIITGGGTFSWSAILAGLVAAFLSIPLVLGTLYGYYRVFEAPRSLYRKSRDQIALIEGQLDQQRTVIEHQRPQLSHLDDECAALRSHVQNLEQQIARAETEKSAMQQQLMKAAERLLPKFEILFENELPYIEERPWDESTRKQTYLRVQVVNNSAKTIESVSVCIESFSAFSGEQLFKNLPLRMMNNDTAPPQKAFSLHPDRGQFIDLATKDSTWDHLIVRHAYEGKRRIGTEEKDVTICVVATGLNAVPAKRRFRLQVDEDGVLHCQPIDPV